MWRRFVDGLAVARGGKAITKKVPKSQVQTLAVLKDVVLEPQPKSAMAAARCSPTG
jgi:hypothetical protein